MYSKDETKHEIVGIMIKVHEKTPNSHPCEPGSLSLSVAIHQVRCKKLNSAEIVS